MKNKLNVIRKNHPDVFVVEFKFESDQQQMMGYLQLRNTQSLRDLLLTLPLNGILNA